MALTDNQKSLLRLMIVYTRPGEDQLANYAITDDDDLMAIVNEWATNKKADVHITVLLYNRLVALGI